MSAWHADAEDWAAAAAESVPGAPVVRYAPTADAPAAAMVVLVGPAAIEDAAIRVGGRMDARMSVPLTIASPGDGEPDVRAMTAHADALVAALVRAGANGIGSRAGTVSLPDAPNPRPARTITATVNIAGTCQ